ncbi:hypothetical protein RRG08_032477 [Elysia crispata]|uniref:Uncharacterized protein n=1 Tax=Elysia crispata TaxID=231223 RepID=A0AAE1ED59_9GAST|nr:hypothetical protein RRG08_032477 [Elysia crispata]
MPGISKNSVLVVSARVKRKLGYYFWNILVIVFLIEAMTLVFLAVDPVGSTRLSLSITLFFTAVAYKLVVRNSLPAISYLTYLDVYVGFVMAYLFLWAAVNALMSHLARYRERQRVLEYDEIAQSCLIGFLILFHLLFAIYIQLTALARRRQMNQLDMRYKMARLMRQGHVNRAMLSPENKSGNNEQSTQNKSGNNEQSTQNESGNNEQSTQNKSGNKAQSTENKKENYVPSTEKKSGSNEQSTQNKSGNIVLSTENKSGNNEQSTQNKSGNNEQFTENKSGNKEHSTENQSGNNVQSIENESGNNENSIQAVWLKLSKMWTYREKSGRLDL